jgi:hypothetical protein
MARKESPEALLSLLERLTDIRSLGLTALPAMADVHPATRRMLASWGYRYDVWSLRRFASAKREAIVLCFLHAARAETTDAAVEMQDKLITGVHQQQRTHATLWVAFAYISQPPVGATSTAVLCDEHLGPKPSWAA